MYRGVYTGFPFIECVAASFTAAAILLFLVVHNAAWFWIDLDIYESLNCRPLVAGRRWQFIGAWCLRELLALPIWILAVLGNEMLWRAETQDVTSWRSKMESLGDSIRRDGKGMTISSC
ncbi:hypothetical protein EDB19DRAFT_1740940 [Suillus lakei]|nr:hypothetical protein EDB19DRAFT_1740940 [Suillus lakei]